METAASPLDPQRDNHIYLFDSWEPSRIADFGLSASLSQEVIWIPHVYPVTDEHGESEIRRWNKEWAKYWRGIEKPARARNFLSRPERNWASSGNEGILPDEVLILICSLVSVKELCILSRVSQQWYNVAADDFVWRESYRQRLAIRSNFVNSSLSRPPRYYYLLPSKPKRGVLAMNAIEMQCLSPMSLPCGWKRIYAYDAVLEKGLTYLMQYHSCFENATDRNKKVSKLVNVAMLSALKILKHNIWQDHIPELDLRKPFSRLRYISSGPPFSWQKSEMHRESKWQLIHPHQVSSELDSLHTKSKLEMQQQQQQHRIESLKKLSQTDNETKRKEKHRTDRKHRNRKQMKQRYPNGGRAKGNQWKQLYR